MRNRPGVSLKPAGITMVVDVDLSGPRDIFILIGDYLSPLYFMIP